MTPLRRKPFISVHFHCLGLCQRKRLLARQGKDAEGTSFGLDLASSVPANRREKKVSLTQSQVKKPSKLTVIVDNIHWIYLICYCDRQSARFKYLKHGVVTLIGVEPTCVAADLC